MSEHVDREDGEEFYSKPSVRNLTIDERQARFDENNKRWHFDGY